MNLQALRDIQLYYKLSDDAFGSIIKDICEHENFKFMSAEEVCQRAGEACFELGVG